MSVKIALNAGHWMGQAGRRCLKKYDAEEHREWWLNNRVLKYFAEYAAKFYPDMELMRTDDVTGATEITLAERCKRANEWSADFYLSAHHNGGINGGSGGGIAAYSYKAGTTGASIRDGLYEALISATGLKGNRVSPKATANLAELRNTSMPAVLIEHGFMDSSVDIPIIISEDFARKCGETECEHIAKAFNLTKKETVQPAEPEREPQTTCRRYYTLAEVNRYYKPTLQKLISKGLFAGKGGTGDEMIVDLSEDACRVLVIQDRAGLFDK